MSKNTRIVSLDGEPCPRCQQPTEIREHINVTRCETARPFYYSRWFNCTNPECVTTVIMSGRFRVPNFSEVTPVGEQQPEPEPPFTTYPREPIPEYTGDRPPWEE